MTKPKIQFAYNDPQKEAEYICFLAKSIQMGYYQKAGMPVLPYLDTGSSKTVHFPDLDYSTEFWQRITTCKNTDYGKGFPKKAVEEVLNNVTESAAPISVGETQHVDKWEKVQDHFFKQLSASENLSEHLKKTKQINIMVTKHGTRGSFCYTKKDGSYIINITYRTDMPNEDIGRTLLLSYYLIDTRERGETGELGWYKRTAAVDFLIKSSVIDLPNELTQFDKQKIDSEVIKQSDEYLSELGFPKDTILKVKENEIVLDGKATNGTFTEQETELLKILLEKAPETVDYDSLALAVWKEYWTEKFSLYALAKIVENVRRKIKENGVNKKVIFNKKGKGYYLNA